MKYNFHTHTARCHHATGTEREYIERAIAGGLTEMGFSDHIPFLCADGTETRFRVQIAEVEDYVGTLRALREEYRDRIAIHIGFECEYYRADFKRMLSSAVAWGAEYLILGQHFCEDESNGAPPSTAASFCDNEAALAYYVDTVSEGLRTGVFTYLAHPDVFRYTANEQIYRREMSRLILTAKAEDVPLELNFLGIRGRRHYPTPMFWEMVGELDAPVTFGFDAHAAIEAYDGESLAVAEEMVKKYGLRYVGRPRLRPLAQAL